MESEGKKLTIYKKIYNIMVAVKHLQKDGDVDYDRTKYKYLSEEKITQNVKKELEAQKVIVFPVKVQDVPDAEKMDKIIVTYRVVDIETGEFIEVQVGGCGKDSGDKKMYKAMTGAFKYFQRQTFFITTGKDDPDSDPSDKTNADIGNTSPPPARQASPPPAAPPQAAGSHETSLSNPDIPFVDGKVDKYGNAKTTLSLPNDYWDNKDKYRAAGMGSYRSDDGFYYQNLRIR